MDLNSLLAYESPGITIFGFKIYAYALIIVFGMLAAFFVISILFKRRNMSTDLFLTFFCICLPIAILTTRLFYCITSGMPIADWLNFNSIREGGLSIIGGILGGAASVAAVCIIKKVNFFRVGDCVVVGLLLAQAIGRWANFANQEVYGGLVENEALHFFPVSVYINTTDGGSCLQTFTLTFAKIFGFETDITGGTWHYAFCLYESVVTFSMAIVLFINAWKNPKKPNGVNTAMYFITYGLVRSIMEPLRDPSFILGSKVPWSMVTSILLLLAGVALLVVLLVLNKKKEGVYVGSVNGDPYGISDFIGDDKKEIAYFNDVNMMCSIYPENYTQKPMEEKSEGFFAKIFGKKDDSSTAEETQKTEKTDGKAEENEEKTKSAEAEK